MIEQTKLIMMEPTPVEEYFIHGVAHIEHLEGDLLRFWLYSIEHGEPIIRLKLVGPLKSMMEANKGNRDIFDTIAKNGGFDLP